METRSASKLSILILGTVLILLIAIFFAGSFGMLNDTFVQCIADGNGLYCFGIGESIKNLVLLIGLIVACGIGVLWYYLYSRQPA
jgi:hypothetical protein